MYLFYHSALDCYACLAYTGKQSHPPMHCLCSEWHGRKRHNFSLLNFLCFSNHHPSSDQFHFILPPPHTPAICVLYLLNMLSPQPSPTFGRKLNSWQIFICTKATEPVQHNSVKSISSLRLGFHKVHKKQTFAVVDTQGCERPDPTAPVFSSFPVTQFFN